MAARLGKDMRGRLLALLRKASVKESDPDAVLLLDTLCSVVHTKREYEDALGTEEGADIFARRHKLTGGQHQVLMAMQVRRAGR
jgi:hypothetical protein